MRLRIRHTKVGKIRFVGHRDLARVWERALRRAELPIAYTEGFHPRPKLHFGLALSVGHESDAEYIDVDLREPVDLDASVDRVGLADRLSAVLPTGVDVTGLIVIDRSAQALQAVVDACTWRFEIDEVDGAIVERGAQQLLAAEELPIEVERKGARSITDVRPLIESIDVSPMAHDAPGAGAKGGATLVVVLRKGERSLRPTEFLGLFGSEHVEEGVEVNVVRTRRIEQWIDENGERRAVVPPAEPVSQPAPAVALVAS